MWKKSFKGLLEGLFISNVLNIGLASKRVCYSLKVDSLWASRLFLETLLLAGAPFFL
jgi:hypothetical protein